MIDQIRASKLPSNMMQFAARGALSVTPDENLEILVYLAKHNKLFGELARMTLAGWDEKASATAAADPKTAREVLDYLISPENLRPKLLPALLENPSIPDSELAKVAISASPDSIAIMLQSARVRAATVVLEALRSNPYLKQNEARTVAELLGGGSGATAEPSVSASAATEEAALATEAPSSVDSAAPAATSDEGDVPEEHISAYLAEHAPEISAEEGKPFQPIGGIMELLGSDYFPVSAVQEAAATAAAAPAPAAAAKPAAAEAPGHAAAHAPVEGKRENTLQKINHLDVKGRIQLALKGNKEERSILIRDGTKVVALAVLEAPKLSDGEVE
ncbi:MAG: hypothetical protein WCC99_23200, partial [Candidatus Sulfotelmatobacter sp.]